MWLDYWLDRQLDQTVRSSWGAATSRWMLISERLVGKITNERSRKHFPPWLMKHELMSASSREIRWQCVRNDASANYIQLNAALFLERDREMNFTSSSEYDLAQWFHLFQEFANPFEIQFPSFHQPNVPRPSHRWLKIKQRCTSGGKETGSHLHFSLASLKIVLTIP